MNAFVMQHQGQSNCTGKVSSL